AVPHAERRSASPKCAVDRQVMTIPTRRSSDLTTSYGSTTANQAKTGNTTQNVAANISGLTGGTTYHFRIVATNSSGTRYGSDRTDTTTRRPNATTKATTNAESRSDTLKGAVDP